MSWAWKRQRLGCVPPGMLGLPYPLALPISLAPGTAASPANFHVFQGCSITGCFQLRPAAPCWRYLGVSDHLPEPGAVPPLGLTPDGRMRFPWFDLYHNRLLNSVLLPPFPALSWAPFSERSLLRKAKKKKPPKLLRIECKWLGGGFSWGLFLISSLHIIEIHLIQRCLNQMCRKAQNLPGQDNLT